MVHTLDFPGPSDALQFAIPRLACIPEPASREEVSAAYSLLEGDHPDRPGAGLGPKARLQRGAFKS